MMNKLFRTVLPVIIAVPGVSSLAFASTDPWSGVYLSGKAGVGFQQHRGPNVEEGKDIRRVIFGRHSSRWDSSSSRSFAGGVAIGYDFSALSPKIPVRLELEWMNNSPARSRSSGTMTQYIPNPPQKDRENKWLVNMRDRINLQTLMVNAYYDMDTGTPFTPYLTAGVGVSLPKVLLDSTMLIPPRVWASDWIRGRSDNFAWSVGVGASYAITKHLSADLSYRFTNMGSLKIHDSTGRWDPSLPTDQPLPEHFSMKLTSSDVLLGIRYTF